MNLTRAIAVRQFTFPIPQRDHIQGSSDAEVALLEYGDFECPACGEVYPVIKAIQEEMDAHLCFAYRHFPLAIVHPRATRAAEAAEAAAAQGSFWMMHDLLFENQIALTDDDLFGYARHLDLDVERFRTEVISGVHRERVREDFHLGVRGGVNGTPTFFINGERYDGPRSLDPLVAALSESRK